MSILVHIQGNCSAGDIRAMLASRKDLHFKPAPSLEASDMVLYTGGADVNPVLYGERKLDISRVDTDRDRKDMECWTIARRMNKFQVGICRGSQFLNVMNGGMLYQDVDGHAGRNHKVIDELTGNLCDVSSTQHQQIRLTNKAKRLAYCELSTKKLTCAGAWIKTDHNKPDFDIEAYWYADSRSLGVQWHPEYGPNSCTELFFRYIKDFKDVMQKEA